MTSPQKIRLSDQLAFAVLGLIGGEAVTAALLAGNPLLPYALATVAIGWAFLALPLVLFISAHLLSELSWPAIIAAGAILGPLTLAALFVGAAGLHVLLSSSPSTDPFEGLFAGTGSLWPKASFISLASTLIYSALSRWKHQGHNP